MVSSIGVTAVMKLEGCPCGVVLRTADDYVEQLTRRRKGEKRELKCTPVVARACLIYVSWQLCV